MEEIKIERKKRLWPWLLISLLVVALLFYFLVNRENNNPESATEAQRINNTNKNDLVAINENNAVVVTYVNFVDNRKDEMSLNHAYTNDALLKLTEATRAMASEVGYDVKADLEKVEEYAKMIVKDPFETTHADNIRKAGDVLTNVLQNIQEAKYPGLGAEVEELRSATALIKPGILTLDQKDEVKNYFAKASDLLKKIKNVTNK
jgi:hypothetical protein